MKDVNGNVLVEGDKVRVNWPEDVSHGIETYILRVNNLNVDVYYVDGWPLKDTKAWCVDKENLILIEDAVTTTNTTGVSDSTGGSKMYNVSNLMDGNTVVKVENNADYNELMDFAEDTVDRPTPRLGFSRPRCYNFNSGAKCTVADEDFYLDKGFKVVRFSQVDLTDDKPKQKYSATKDFTLVDVQATSPCLSTFSDVLSTLTQMGIALTDTIEWTDDIEQLVIDKGWDMYLLDVGLIKKN